MRIRSIFGYRSTLMPENRDTHKIQENLAQFTYSSDKKRNLNSLCPNWKDTKCSSNRKKLISKTSFHLLFCLLTSQEIADTLEKPFLKKFRS